jgi:hypothetical protein
VGGKPQLPDVHAFFGWSKGLKTIYYLRRKETQAQQFTIEEKKPVGGQTGACRDVQF